MPPIPEDNVVEIKYKFKKKMLVNIKVNHFLRSEPEELPILVASVFCGRGEAQLSEDCKK